MKHMICVLYRSNCVNKVWRYEEVYNLRYLVMTCEYVTTSDCYIYQPKGALVSRQLVTCELVTVWRTQTLEKINQELQHN
jgi:hypothetical protein